jgi:hypothetical protein
VDIYPSAQRHGVADEAIRPAVAYNVYAGEVSEDEPPTRVLYLGPDHAGNMLEIVVIERDDGPSWQSTR